MLEEEVGVMRNAMTTRAPCGAKNIKKNQVDAQSHYHPHDRCMPMTPQ